MSMLPDDLFFDGVRPDETAAAHELERAGYPEDEAASLDALRYRQSVAPELFLGAYVSTPIPRTLIGFIVATLSPSPTLTHDSMEKHKPLPVPSSVCVHSVCVSSAYHRKGIALRLLEEYLQRIEKMPNAARVLLICKANLKALYLRAGFIEVGPSSVIHGKDSWYEMRRDIKHSSQPPANTQPSQATVLAALQQQSSRPKKSQLPYTSFSSPSSDLTYADPGETILYNTHKLTCPREACGSLILLRGVGVWHEASTGNHPEIFTTPESGFPAPLPPPDQPSGWWLVKPSPMQFENIGFSRAVPSTGASASGGIKYLSCAECDLGPLGWCFEQGATEFWLSASRVGYRAA